MEDGPMTRYRMVDVRANLADLINRVGYGGERIAIGRRGKDVAVLVSVEDAALLESLEDEIDVAAARKALREKGPAVAWEDVKKALAAKRSKTAGV